MGLAPATSSSPQVDPEEVRVATGGEKTDAREHHSTHTMA